MSATALPLPLVLSNPAPMVSDWDAQLKASLGVVSNTYNPETQVGVYGRSEPRLAWGVDIAWTNSNSQTNQTNVGGMIVIDDIVVDDNDFN